ncbi:MAG: response regulator transcription factor [Gammaproteobacteria bacterium]|nr:response regulator transcription factor [Gammaproteobacteria bacterium]
MRILVIEDEPQLREQVAARLQTEGYVVDQTGDGTEGKFLAEELPLDLAIIDLGLPNVDGSEIIKHVRTIGRNYPIIILTARSSWDEKVRGLEAGADDYITKPFHIEELIARVRAVIRRSGGWSASTLDFDGLSIDTQSHRVTVDENSMTLTAYEFRVLEYLAINAGKVISKSELTEHIYPDDEDRDSNVLEVFIRRVRKKIDPDNTKMPIETLRGQGYRFALTRKTSD